MSVAASAEATFRSFTPAEASAYAQFRLDYHPTVYNTILTQHTSTGGKLDTLLDVGCGPGTAVRTLATRFQHAIGFDPSEGMIASAKKLGGTSASGDPIRFDISSAEDLAGIADGSIDLLTAATAAHWFDMPGFWKRAAQVLKPGGSVAIWTYGGGRRFGPSMPNAEAINAEMDVIRETYLKPYTLPGNILARDLYVDLALPWGVDPPVEGFDEASFARTEWGTEVEGALPDDEFFAVGAPEVNMQVLEAMLGTASPVVRWREANKELVGTEGDVVRIMRRMIERCLHDVGVEEGKETVKGGVAGALLVVKKTA